MLQMPDGSILVLSANDNQSWYRLTPDSHGSYVNGTWSFVGLMNIPRLYFASVVLPDGRVFIIGGEYTGPYYDSNITGSAEIFDPSTGTSTWIARYPICQPGSRSVTLTSDVVLSAGSTTVTGIYSTDRIEPTAGTWTVTGTGIPASTSVVSVDSPTQVTISKTATITGPSAGVRFAGRSTSCFGDDYAMQLPSGNILGASLFTPTPYIYSFSGNSWSPAATKFYNDRSDEEGWAYLDDGRMLTYDIFQTISKGSGYAELYDPVANVWSSISPADGHANGTLPVLSSSALGDELGPLLRLLDGRMIVVGANQHTGLYTPSTNTWAAGPDLIGPISNPFGTIPNGLYGADDAPAAMLPNGHMITEADAGPNLVVQATTTTTGSPVVTMPSTAGLQPTWPAKGSNTADIPSGTTIASVDSATQVTLSANAKQTTTVNVTYGGTFSPPAALFDFNPATGTMTMMNVPDPNLQVSPSYIGRMLMLPTGQLLFNDSSNQMLVYNPDGLPPTASRPHITSVVANGGGSYTLTGTQIHGQSAGAAYGDDVQEDSNYPIVRLEKTVNQLGTCDPESATANCTAYYARTSNWASAVVGGGSALQTVTFTVPAGVPSGKYWLTVSGAGLQSLPVMFTVP